MVLGERPWALFSLKSQRVQRVQNLALYGNIAILQS